jgi:hypothetical protein
MRAVLVLVALSIAGCGRLDFADRTGSGGGGGGGNGDAVSATVPGDDGGGTNSLACADRTIPMLDAGAGNFSGTLTAASNATGSCGGSQSEDVYTFTLAGPSPIAFQANLTGTTAQTVLYLRTSCDDPATEVACGTGKGGGAALYFDALPAGTYYLFVDGDSPGAYMGTMTTFAGNGGGCSVGLGGCTPGLECQDGTVGPRCRDTGCVVAQALDGPGPFSIPVTTSGPSEAAATCGGNDGGLEAPEQIYSVTLSADVSDMHVSTIGAATDFDTIVYVRGGDCTTDDIACNDDASTSTRSSDLHTGPLAAGLYYVFVDGFIGQSGNAQLSIDTTP